MPVSPPAVPDVSRALFGGDLSPRIFICLMAVATASLVMLGGYLFLSSSGKMALISRDGILIADTAQQLARGRGFSSAYMTPMGLASSSRRPGMHPSLLCPPLPAVALAPFLGIFGSNNRGVMLGGLFWYCVQLVLLCWVADALCGRRIAIGAALLTLLNPVLFRPLVCEGPSMACLLPFSLLILAVARRWGRGDAGGLVIGMALGLCYLALPPHLVLAIPVAVYLFIDRPADRGVALLAFGGGVLLVAGPWLLRDAVVTGNPFWSLKWSSGLYSESLLHLFEPTGITSAGSGLWSIRFALANTSRLFGFTGNLTGLLFLVGLLVPSGEKALDRVKYFLASCILMLWLFMGGVNLFAYQRYALPFIPPICFAAAVCLEALYRSYRPRSLGMTGGFALVVVLVLLPFDRPGRGIDPYYTYTKQYYDAAFKNIPDDAAVASDAAIYLSWYGKRRSVELNYVFADFLAMRSKNPAVAAVYFSPDFKPAWIDGELTEGWGDVYDIASRGGIPPSAGFKKGEVLNDGDLLLYD
jgi:hypothetical protein